ncbi:uncharacterized protein [Miscanthus floridulus]|uniref:uncharacterized protein isoform X2 n=1 Tax=Miscanthus floridulus TaxID=154761 RepID=UPI003459B5E9
MIQCSLENGQADNVEDDDLQPHYKYLSLVEKRQNVMKQRKIDIVSSKKQVAEHSNEATNLDSSTPATINISLQTEQDDYVEYKDLPAHYKYNCTKDKVVAKETSATPSNFEASGYQKHHRGTTNWSTGNSMMLGKEFCMVHVSFAVVHDEPLIQPYKGYKVIGDVEGGVTVTWPSTFLKKINI